MTTRPHQPPTPRSRQQGYALIVFVALLTTAALTLAAKVVSNNAGNQITRDKITADALAQAREALIGRAATDNNRPGTLPCPDNNNDGIADLLSGNNCPSYIGRLPWRTLGLPDINDGSRERLWYALSNNFRDDNSAEPINSDTQGNRSVYDPNNTLITDRAVAVVFSAGDALAGQRRETSINEVCTATGTSLPRNWCVSNYLDADTVHTLNNASQTGPYIAGRVLDTSGNLMVNDKLVVIQARDIMPIIEKRVASEVRTLLIAYFAANHYYPYPAPYSNAVCDHSHCQGDTSLCRGRLPRSEASGNANWNLPGWIRSNDWYRTIYYSVGKSSLQFPTGITCSATLTVTGSGTVNAVFFTSGTPVGSITRPSNSLSDYLEDSENRDGWSAGANDTYVPPTASAVDRDRLITLP